MKEIECLMLYDDAILHSWKDPQNKAVWVILADNMKHINTLTNCLSAKHTNYNEFKEYFLDEGAWLSIAFAPNLELALQVLEEKIVNFTRDFEWRNDVFDVYEWLSKPVNLENNGIETLKNTFRRTGIVQPENGVYMLQQLPTGYKRITVDVRTLQVVNEENIPNAPSGWTSLDIKSLLDEGTRFIGTVDLAE